MITNKSLIKKTVRAFQKAEKSKLWFRFYDEMRKIEEKYNVAFTTHNSPLAGKGQQAFEAGQKRSIKTGKKVILWHEWKQGLNAISEFMIIKNNKLVTLCHGQDTI